MPLFHFAQMTLGPGSIIEPGNWGRLLRRYQYRPAVPNGPMFGNAWMLVRELAFEVVRLKTFPTLPSRMNACFALDTEQAVSPYREKNDPHQTSVLHVVEIVDGDLPIHRGDLSFVTWPTTDVFLDAMQDQALQYWRGEGEGDREVVTASALRVLAVA